MSKRASSKYKIDRRMGENIWGRPKSPVNRREYGPGQHGQRRKGKLSDFGLQLLAKKKLKGHYGDIYEKQFRKTYEEADGHVKVNGGRVNIGSYRCKAGDVIEVREKSKQLVSVLESVQLAERDVPDYIEADHNKMVATFARIPTLSDVPYAVVMAPNLVDEYYSR